LVMENAIIDIFDYFGTVIFAVTGGIRGRKSHLDLLGVMVLACVVGVGGGIFRDLCIGAVPVTAISHESYLICCMVTGCCVFYWGKSLDNIPNIITYLDAVGLGVFTVLGAAKGFECGITPVGIVLAGVVTAVGGGVVRDIMVGTVPVVLKSDFYATASLIGGCIYLLLRQFTPLPQGMIFFGVAGFVTGIRILAWRFRFHLPRAEEFASDKH